MDPMFYEDEIECPECGGWGFVEDDEGEQVDCDECDGSGLVAP